MLAKFFNDEKLTFATNSANLPTSWLQTRRDLFGSLALIFYLKFRMQFHLFFIHIKTYKFTLTILLYPPKQFPLML
ncbi:PIN family toxin-antitoxin system [Fusobacterium nucleatum YWH7053]|nr:PIN family toxin-antitoxin system [Fusobacterium nucleatum YWH7053]